MAKAVIADTLGLGLTVDPRVAGNISLSSGRALSRNELLLALESALRATNASMVKDGSGYRIIPTGDAAGTAGIDSSRDPSPGFGVSVLPLRFITADNMMKLMEGFSTKPGAVRIDPTRNLLIVQGSGEERRVALETAAAFDQNWMRGQSVGIYPLQNSSPDTVINELQRIMDAGDNGAYKGLPNEKSRDIWGFLDVNFAKVAENMGCVGMRVEKPADLPAALKKAITAGKPVVIDVVTDENAMAPTAWTGGAASGH